MGRERTLRDAKSGTIETMQQMSEHTARCDGRRPQGSILSVFVGGKGCIAQDRKEAQGGDGAEDQEAEADEGENGREPLVLVAGRRLVELLSGQDTAGQSDGGSRWQIASEDGGPLKGAPVRIGDAH